MAAFDAPAKINLFLHVLAREHTGYHQIETLFCRLELADVLEIEAGQPGITLHVDGADSGPPADNLVVRAARAFCERAGIEPAFRITLHPRIPVGAGLGGGSSDAATTLRALATMHAPALERMHRNRGTSGTDQASNPLLSIAREIGSDVPFFVSGAALALGWGRGERLLALPALPRRPVLIVAPRTPIATADAYRALAARRAAASPPATSRVLGARRLADWSGVQQIAHNDFDDVAFDLVPGLEEVRNILRASGALIALLCGSGSALFGVFETDDQRAHAARRLRDEVPGHACVETYTAEP